MKGRIRKLVNVIAVCVFWFLVLFSFPTLCDGHADHDHHHHNENPSFKYSRTANEHFHEHVTPKSSVKPENNNVWFEAILATVLISLAPFLILFFVPLSKSENKDPILKILLSFASGGLLGDAFLHLIPHALEAKAGPDTHAHSHAHSHNDEEPHGHDMSVGISVLLGIITFLLVEKGVKLIKGGPGHSHSLKAPEIANKNVGSKATDKKNEDKKKEIKKSKGDKNATVIVPESLAVSGYLNLAADFTHNVTDGLAIGASFLAGRNIGIVTTFTILLHEIPHEIGDYAILIKSGCSKKKAMLLQLVTAVGALCGTLVALLAEGSGDVVNSWILPFTAGGFIYISTVSIIPELLEDSKFFQSLLEIAAMLVGVFLMILIADFE